MIIDTFDAVRRAGYTMKRNGVMITNDLQKRIHFGDRDAFRAVYEAYGHEVYAAARGALGSNQLAKSAVRQAFLSLFNEMLSATDDVDIHASVKRLADYEVTMLRLLHGGASEEPQDAPSEPELASARVSFSIKDGFSADLPPLVRDNSFRRPGQALFIKKRGTRRGKRRTRGAFGKALILLFALALLWILVGALMKFGYLPALDLGYGWFSRTVYPLFTPGA